VDGRGDEEVLWRGKREKWVTRVTPGEVRARVVTSIA
jgi:hypothetical protein